MTTYSFGQTLLRIRNVSLSFKGRPVLKNVNAEIRDITVPGRSQGQVIGFLGPSGIGKCLAKGTRVLMHDGSIKRVEEVNEGDLLMGPDSKPRTVLALGHGFDQMYEIAPNKGDSYTVNAPHILALHLSKSKHSRERKVEIAVEDYLKQSRTFKARAKTYRVPVDFPAQHVTVDPYFLGLWLGDGDADSPTIANEDAEVIDAVKQFAQTANAEVSTYEYGGCPRFRVHNEWRRDGSVLSAMRSLGVFQQKHVPLSYKANTRSVRLELLAGLIDSDGSLASNCYDFVNKEKTLAEDVCYLARSLGFAASFSPCIKRAQTGVAGTYYRVIISGDTAHIPVRVHRKKARERKINKDVLRSGFEVRDAGHGEYFGFQLDGDGLFLLGDFTVTHNTQLFRVIAGLNKPDEGTVEIFAGDHFKPTNPGDVGVVAQSYPLFEHRSVISNLVLAAEQAEKDSKLAKEKAESLLAEFDLADKANLYPAQLSGGQRQRCAIIQQILCSEHFLLMDEPFSGLDLLMLEKTTKLISQIANRHCLNTIIVITHDVTAAAVVADHIWLMGRDTGSDGKKMPGARIVKEYNLIERGLAWQPGIATSPALVDFSREVKEEFRNL